MKSVRGHVIFSVPMPCTPVSGALRRHLTVLLLLKCAALALLWVLFFSPAHRIRVDARAVERRLAVGQTRAARDPAPVTRPAAAGEAVHD